MLSERQLQDVLGVFEKRMQVVIEQYVKLMGEHIRDIGRLTPSDVNRLVQMKRVNANIEKIKRQVAKAVKLSLSDVETAFKAVAEIDYRFAAELFGADHTPRIKDNKYLERILKAQLRVTKQELANISRTTIIPEQYRNAVDIAIQTAQAGVTDYNSAIRTAMKDAASAGLRVEYPSGLTRRLDTAVRMNVLDGIRAINRDVMQQAGKEFKADGIEISAHALCAEDHLPYQGTQMSNKEFERLQNRLDRPFGMWNCKHMWWPILLGVSQPTHTEEELRAYAENSNELITVDGATKTRYQWTQEQRRLETAIRYQKDAANLYKASGDTVGRRNAQATINALRERYSKVSEAAGLREDVSRMRVAGFARVKTANQLKNSQKPDIIKLPDIQAIPSLGAKSLNDDVLDLITGERYHLVPGTHIKNVEVYAGKGVKEPYRKAYIYADSLGGKVEDWQHVKGDGWIDCYGEERHVEIHWSRCEGIGNVDRFIKRWLDED